MDRSIPACLTLALASAFPALPQSAPSLPSATTPAQPGVAVLHQAEAAIAAKDWRGAKAILQGLDPTAQGTWQFHQLLGKTQLMLGETEDSLRTTGEGVAQAKVALGSAKASDRGAIRLAIGQMLVDQGNACLKLKRMPEALAAYRQAIDYSPDESKACFNLSATYYNLGDLEHAAEFARRTISADPLRSDAYFILGSALFADAPIDQGGHVILSKEGLDVLNTYLKQAPEGSHAPDVRAMLDMVGQTRP